jgi:type IV pilus assembly protein PilC
MSLFEYKAVYRKQTIEDSLTAANLEDAKLLLKNKGYKIVWLRKAKGGKKSGKVKGRVPVLEKANYCRYMATMMEAGLPITEAVEVYAEDTGNKTLKAVLTDVLGSIEKGQSLTVALARHEKVFDPLFIALIKAGEASGTLSDSFEYLAKQLFADYDLRRKVKGAMMYPAIVVTLMSFIMGLVVFFVIPKIAPIFLQMGLDLPWFTRAIFQGGLWVSDNKIFLIGLLAGLGVGVLTGAKTETGKKWLLKIIGLAPQVRKLLDQLDMARFARVLATLMASGVPVNQATGIVFGSMSQFKFKSLAGKFEGEIKKGNQISAVMRKEKIFPKMVVRMVATGEKAGTMDKMLAYLADFYEAEVENQLHDLTNLLEPILMLCVGIGVGILVLSVIAPIYSLVGSLSM